jgi:acyl carrier protein
MTNQEKIVLLEDMFELDKGTITGDTLLSDIDNWDSMGKLSLIVLMDEEFSKKLTGTQIKELNTIEDILKFME